MGNTVRTSRDLRPNLFCDLGKAESVRDWPEPTNVTEVKSFLGLASYYRKFINGFCPRKLALSLNPQRRDSLLHGTQSVKKPSIS